MASVVRPVESMRRRRALLVALGLLVAAGLLAGWRWWPRSRPSAVPKPSAAPDDPRLTFATPYRNVRPEVQYVGREACADCHPRQTRTFLEHPMGRSLAPVQDARVVERFDEAAKNPFNAQGFRYQVVRRGGQVLHHESATDPFGRPVFESEVEVLFAVGSGTRGRTYLLNRGGYLFQSPITWFPQKQAWDLSPGFEQLHHHFGRPVPTDCLFCHSNRAVEVPDTQNRYREPIFEGHAIGCERCHGPGELHVASPSEDGTIVNPGRLSPTLREAVCEQCHLQGIARVLRRGRQAFEYRPGLPLHLFLAVFVKPPTSADPHKFVGQVEQMHASRCFQASVGKMGCISCHDPHVYPAVGERVDYYRTRCLNCHADKGCSVPPEVRRQTSKDDSCIQCHMPAGESDIQHHSITDHRVPRKPSVASPAGPVIAPADRGMPMQLFHHELLPANDPEAARDLGVALVDRVERYPAPVRRALGRLALPLLEAALRTDPDDVAAWDAKAHALWAADDPALAAAAFEEALTRAPGREITLQWAAALAMEQRRPEAAVAYWQRALEVNPYRHEFHSGLAAAQAQRNDWPAVYRACQDSLRLNPANLGARKLLVEYYLEAGQPDRARTEFDLLLGLRPPDEDTLRAWFAQRRR